MLLVEDLEDTGLFMRLELEEDGDTDFRFGAKASGFDAYVTKPIEINSLKELINGLLI